MPVFYDAINLATNQLEQARIENLGSDPGSGVEGQIYFNTTSDKLMELLFLQQQRIQQLPGQLV